MLIVAILFIGVFASIFGAYLVFVVAPEGRGQAALRRRLRWQGPKETGVDLLKKPEVLSTIDPLNAVLKNFGAFSDGIKETIHQAGLKMTVGTFLLLSIAIAGTVLLIVETFTGVWWISALAALPTAFIPLLVVRFLRTRRIHQFEEQFPE